MHRTSGCQPINAMTEAQWNRTKASQVCSFVAFLKIKSILEIRYQNIPEKSRPTVMNHFYSITSHREFLSKFTASVCIAVLKFHGWNAFKKPDKGKPMHYSSTFVNAAGTTRTLNHQKFIPNQYATPGEPDITMELPMGNGLTLRKYIEIKINKDTMKPHQLSFKADAVSRGEEFYIVKSVDEFLEKLPAITSVEPF